MSKIFARIQKRIAMLVLLPVLAMFAGPAFSDPSEKGVTYFSMHIPSGVYDNIDETCEKWRTVASPTGTYIDHTETEAWSIYNTLNDIDFTCNYEEPDLNGDLQLVQANGSAYCLRPDNTWSLSVCKVKAWYEVCLNELVGNPIAFMDGRKIERATDWVSPVDGRFQFDRTYNSQAQERDPVVGSLGADWSSSWMRSIHRGLVYPGDNQYSILFGDGTIYNFYSFYSFATKWLERPREKGHNYRVRRNVAGEGGRDILYHASGRKDLFEDVDINLSRLSESRWQDGYSIFVTYDANNRIAALTDNKGQRAEYTWADTLHPDITIPVITKIEIDTAYDGVTLNKDVEIAFIYFASGGELLNIGRMVTNVASTQILSDFTYTYDITGINPRTANKLIGISDGRVDSNSAAFNYASFAYDTTTSRTHAVQTRHMNGANEYADEYVVGLPVATATGYDVTVTNPLGKDTTYSIEDIDGQLKVVNVEGIATISCLPSNTSMVRDTSGRVIEQTERNGARTVITRDGYGRVLTRTEDADGLSPRVTTQTWRALNNYVFPADGFKPLTRTTSELQEVFTYGTDGLLTSYAQTDVLVGSPDNGKVRTWTYGYTTLVSGLKVLTSVDGPGLVVDGVTDVTTYEYNANGQLTKTTDANGLVQEVLAFDVTGLPSLVRDHQSFEWALDYDLNGRLITSTFRPGVLDETTTYTYDIIGQMISSTDSLGRTWGYTYNEARRLVKVTAPSGETITFSHDAMGNVTRTEYKDAGAVLAYLEETQYDELGRILQALGSNGQSTSFAHDVEDNVSSVTDATLQQSSLSYDALNRMTDIVDRASFTTSMEHDDSDQVTSYTDPRGIATTFSFNGFGELTSEVSADRGTLSYSYNNRGLTTSMTDGRGIVTNYSYDNGGRLTGKTFPSDPTLDQTYTYHSNPAQPHNLGSLASATDQTGQSTYSNDPTRGSFYEDLRGVGMASYPVRYTSQAEGEVVQIAYPSGSRVLRSFDADGDLAGVQWQAYDAQTTTYATPVDVVSGLTYKPVGPLSSMTYGDGGVLTATHDSSYRLTGLLDTRLGITLRDETYNWTNRDNLSGVTDNLDPAQNQTFTYSAREKLAGADGVWGEFDFTYDGVGNRTQQMSMISNVSTTDTYSYPLGSNRLEQITFSTGGLRTLTYDAAGNVTFDNRNGPGYGYNYDAAGRMSSFAINGVIQAEYEYNYLGQQVIRRLPQTLQTIHSVHDAAGNRIAEYLYDESLGTSTLIREYIWADGMIVGVLEAGQMYYVRTDHIGRPVFATDNAGTKVWEASYLPFGGVQASSGPNPELRFPGQWFQSESGLHQNWMRDYDPTLGRYIQADPLGLIDGASVYGYALQNPGRYVDPRGEAIPLLYYAGISIGIGVAITMIWGDDCYTFKDLLWDGSLGIVGGAAVGRLGPILSRFGAGGRGAGRAGAAGAGAASGAAGAGAGAGGAGAGAGAGAQAGAAAGAHAAAAAGATRGAAATVVSGLTGRGFTGLSRHAATQSGQQQVRNEGLEQIAEGFATGCRGYGAACAELDALAQMVAAEGWGSLQGAVMAAAQIGTRNGGSTGQIIAACPSCQSLLTVFGVGF